MRWRSLAATPSITQSGVFVSLLFISYYLPSYSSPATSLPSSPLPRFGAVTMRIRDPRCTALIFSTGKMVCTGSKCEEDAYKASRKFARIIQKLQTEGPKVSFKEYKVVNMVANCDVRFPIRLERMATQDSTSTFCTYEPELSPGLVYRMIHPKITLRIFASGKISLTGGKTREQLQDAFRLIYPILLLARKK